MTGERGADKGWWLLLGAIVALGLALRIAGAQGALWLDEAWSATQARDAGTPLGVFLYINHDNNHHLNSLWLQFVGVGAPPPLARALSVATSTATIAIAGLIGARRGALPGLLTALLFAVSPVMVTLGSEARGYAPMLLALMTAILLVDRWLAGELRRTPATALALCFFLGAFSQLTILFGFCAVAGWAMLTLWQRDGFRPAFRATALLFLPATIALILVLGIIFGAAATHHGFKFGNYEPFTLMKFLHGISEMVQYSVGFIVISIWWFAAIPALVVIARGAGVSRLSFYWLAILAFPVTLALLQAGNIGHPRYYLLIGAALLLLLGELLWLGWRAGGWKRILGGTAFAAIVVASLVQDVDLAINRRGNTGLAVQAMQARAPEGARLILERDTGLATLEVAAAVERYPLEISLADCPPGRFFFADRFRGEQDPPNLTRCGQRYAPILSHPAHGMSGTHWTLYERQP
jgi:hypothetical protein